MTRILHLNIADFAVAVERAKDPSLKGWAVLICRGGMSRSLVYDMSEEAYRYGVRKGMPLAAARSRVPGARELAPCTIRYERAMAEVLKRARMYSPLVEAGRDDGHVFIDTIGTKRLFGPSRDVARHLGQQIHKDLGFMPVWGIAANRLVAKVATRTTKPSGEAVVEPGDEAGFLAPLPVKMIPGIDRHDAAILRDFNLFTVSRVRQLTKDDLSVILDDRAAGVYDRVRGIDRSAVRAAESTDRFIRCDHTFKTDTNRPDDLKGALLTLTGDMGRQLAEKSLLARNVHLRTLFSDGTERSGNVHLKPPASDEFTLFRHTDPVLTNLSKKRIRVRHMALVCTRTAAAVTQMALFPEKAGKTEKLSDAALAMDRIRKRFGTLAVRPATALSA